MKEILIVEDNEDLVFGLQNNLEIEGYGVDTATDGETGLEKAMSGNFDLVVLDLTLPLLDGMSLLSRLREARREVPVLILTARGEEVDKVRGLKLGADDYMTKPFGVMELLARVEALIRRSGAAFDDAAVVTGNLEVDAAARTVRRDGVEVELAPRELELLLALIKNRGKVVSREQLLAEVWGHAGKVVTRTVDTHIAELRRKLEDDPSRPRFILTSRKAGYRFAGAEEVT